MSDISNTVARPYAKAIFEFAVQHGCLAMWSDVLACLTALVNNPTAQHFLKDPGTTHTQQSELMFSVLTQVQKVTEPTYLKNLLDLLAHNKRLLVLPNIYAQYQALRDAHEKTMVIDVVSFAPLTKKQEEHLTKRLGQRLQRHVTLNITLDRSLRGGLIVRAGHMVFDASVATQIKKLAATLAA